ncbi:hypothetical protein ACE103_16170 [Bradyrhizobium sp. ma5]|uniref:hypothetical protein n=1 Tax=Bradyrhizobium sp. ma5 TaxID=3344828 RepID=UPI0035D40692
MRSTGSSDFSVVMAEDHPSVKGRILKNDPVGPPMSGAEFAALVKTLPEAQQRKIETLLDLFLVERGQ